ncbi:GNAT family N-acetyltransferase [Aciduricibacillus chroicocephali]|uniref:GNAT family N-acetyltransferase n=1 Tax=Aciduricibacillus chroicocephali TaxID=3054939 RepID=A0ABY9KT89_9BACI|nr:GNAT family N-acetyltransferase [Bacillaceae bacterium 44XB]
MVYLHIRILNKSDSNLYQTLRLQALLVSPEAFESTYQTEVNYTQDAISAHLSPTDEKFILGAFNDNNALVGMVTFSRESDPKTSHKGSALSLYVAPEVRKQGFAKLLMEELIKRGKNLEGLEQINLTVASENLPAKNLYLSLGFKTFGVERNSFKFNGKYYDVDLMDIFV